MTGSRPAAALDLPDELARRAAQGDVAAFARIVRLYHEDMTRVAFVVTGDMEAAAEATNAAWPVAWGQLRRPRVPGGLGPWLCSLAAAEATFLARLVLPSDAPAPLPTDNPAGDGIGQSLAGLDPEDRALLALCHVAGLSPEDLARVMRRSRPPIPVRLLELEAALGGPQPPGFDPAGEEHRLRQRLRAYADVPVRPVDADATARRVRAGEAGELARLVSVVISAIIGVLVAGWPYLAMLLHRR